jgi:hydroxymethylbilane synthase
MRLVVGSRGSKLALWQAHWARDTLQKTMPHVEIVLEIIRTQGDDSVHVPFEQLPGKGFFVKEIEEALLAEKIDLAVHSMKDLPEELPDGLMLAGITKREDPRDVLVTLDGRSLEDLEQGARVGTGSPRRAAQLRYHRDDLVIQPLRGNVDTRVRRLQEGRHDAIVLAAAGLNRLSLEIPRVPLEVGICTPAVGQGALGLETRRGHDLGLEAARTLQHDDTQAAVQAERAFLRVLGGGCQVPIAGYARVDGERLHMVGAVASPDGSELIREEQEGTAQQPDALGESLGKSILGKGGGELLREDRRD